jgi:hypothetical protein
VLISRRPAGPPVQPAHRRAHHGQLLVQLLGRIPAVAVPRHPAVGVEAQMAGTVDAHRCGAGVARAEVKVPGQEAVVAAGRDGQHLETRRVELLEHVTEDAGDGGHALHPVERVLEARAVGMDAAQRGQIGGHQGFVQRHHPLHAWVGMARGRGFRHGRRGARRRSGAHRARAAAP